MSVASKNFEREAVISEEESSEMSKSDSDFVSPGSPPNQAKSKNLLTQSAFKDKNIFRGSFLGGCPPEIIIKAPETHEKMTQSRTVNKQTSLEKHVITASPISILSAGDVEFFNKSFKCVVEKVASNEKILLRTSLSRRKTSHFGAGYNFLSCCKPKIMKKNVS